MAAEDVSTSVSGYVIEYNWSDYTDLFNLDVPVNRCEVQQVGSMLLDWAKGESSTRKRLAECGPFLVAALHIQFEMFFNGCLNFLRLDSDVRL